MTSSLRSDFMLDPEITYLNHGSFGACPRVVHERYQEWQRTLEWNPVAFIQKSTPDYLKKARAALGAYLHTDPNNLVYFPNPTTAGNMIIRSLNFQPGDEILTSNFEYGAMNNTWEFYCRQTGAKYIHQEFPLWVKSQDEFVEALWAGVNERTKMIYLSHITSPTAMIYPIEEICRRARAAGIMTYIDGAHAPSQVDVDLDALDCDFYIGACHKWMCAPKGAAFAYVNPAYHEILSPIVVSSGWVGCAHNPVPEGISSLVHYQEYQGTRDISAFLTVPTAIEYQQSHDWEAQRARCHQLAARTQEEMCAITGLEPFSPGTPEFVGQFVAVPLPDGNWEAFAEHVRERMIVVPVFPLQGHNQNMMRVSYQAYNDENDMDRLLEALKDGLSLF